MKPWKKLENPGNTRSHRERDERLARQAAALEAAREAERQEDRRLHWAAYSARKKDEASYAAYEDMCVGLMVKERASPVQIRFAVESQRMVDKRPSDTDCLIDFLARDPWEFRSGYRKADVIQHLKQLSLSEVQKETLRSVALYAVDGRDRREFRYYCRLARAVQNPALREALRVRLEHTDPGVRRRARWMLNAVEKRA